MTSRGDRRFDDGAVETLQLGLQTFQDQTLTEWGPLMAGTTITVLPLLLIFILGQRFFVEGIALTGTKG